MGIIILFGSTVLALIGFFLGRVLAIKPEQREVEDDEQMDWLRKYQETMG